MHVPDDANGAVLASSKSPRTCYGLTMAIDLKEPGFSEAEVHERDRGIAERLQEALKPAVARVQTAYAAAQRGSAEKLDTAERYVRDAPLKSIGIALVAGLLVGILIGTLQRTDTPDETLE